MPRRRTLFKIAGIVSVGLIALGVLELRDDASSPAPEMDSASAPDQAKPIPEEWDRDQPRRSLAFLSPSGRDRDEGSPERPWRTLDRALTGIAPGGSIVLAPGSYGARGKSLVIEEDGNPGSPTTIRGVPGNPRPVILGAVRVRASHIHLDHLELAGPTGPVRERSPENPGGEQVQLAIDGGGEPVQGVSLTRSLVRDSDWHAGVYLEDVEDAQILANRITRNGDENDPAQENRSHGVYWASGSGIVANNVIDRNVARGIQLYPEPSEVLVAHNTIVGNGAAGIQLGRNTSRVTVVNNLVAFNRGSGIRPADLDGEGNLARRNLLWANGPLFEESDGLTITETIRADPSFMGSFTPDPESEAVDGGLPLHEVTRDMVGVLRGPDNPDIGAFESQ